MTTPQTYLTIDDAPSPELPEKLAILDAEDVPALFFCEGRRLADYPDHARRAVEAGYHLGNHAYSHQHASELSVETFRDEVERTDDRIEDVYADAGVARPAKLFRFPYGDRGGDCSGEFQHVLETNGFTPPDPDRIAYEWYQEEHADNRDWFWTVSVDDWTVDSRSELREQVAASADRLAASSADIVLFHDAGNSPELFEHFVELLLDRGVEFGDPLSLVPSGGRNDREN